MSTDEQQEAQLMHRNHASSDIVQYTLEMLAQSYSLTAMPIKSSTDFLFVINNNCDPTNTMHSFYRHSSAKVENCQYPIILQEPPEITDDTYLPETRVLALTEKHVKLC